MGKINSAESVSVVVTTFNDAQYLVDALSSIVAQRLLPTEILVVDDGSSTSPAAIVANFDGVKLIRKNNGGLASARNVGLYHARSQFIIFLDADDRLESNAIDKGLARFREVPGAAFVYGGHRRIRADGSRLSNDIFQSLGEDPYADLLKRNLIGMHATVLYRRSILADAGGFDERLRRCEDYDVYLRLASKGTIAAHSSIVAEYRWHGSNISADTSAMLRAVLRVHRRHRHQRNPSRRSAWREGRYNWTEWYQRGQSAQWGGRAPDSVISKVLLRAAALWTRFIHQIRNKTPTPWPPSVGSIDFGQLATTRPVSQDFGWDRGTPVDRFYIEDFLRRHASDIKGRVLEVGDASYSKRFGGANIQRQDVLHVDLRHPSATLIGDLTDPKVLPDDAFDCIVLTQTLHLIFELPVAVSRLYAALKSGGVLLLTVPGISQIDRLEWAEQWCWSFTAASVRKLFDSVFSANSTVIETHGNVFAAISFLTGAVVEEVDSANLTINDPAYPLIVTMRAQKA